MTSESESNELDSGQLGDDLPTIDSDRGNLKRDGALDATLDDESSSVSSRPLPVASEGAKKLPELAGYELLAELGRGGMGVVYRARHKKLDRPVAIKMILAGQFASPESIARFELEAESAARLDHPGIVPIYEIGQADEHRFFSMKLIDGAPLSDLLEQYRPDQSKAVELMIRIAEAVQHAHQRGVLHRDLKPGNVLIDSEGSPLLTDLGLAKQLDNDSAITQTGLVLGSPGFMSPEQAAGKTDVTVAADVYAMGAILYWLVSGRAPITGESAFEIVRKTIDDDPQSICDLRADADRDLNLICLKALQKVPSERYASAEEFGAELQAWLDGEQLSVKPPTLFTTIRRWLQKNFRGMTVGVGVGALSGLMMGFIILLQIAEGQLNTANALHEQLRAADPPWITTNFGWVTRIPAAVKNNLTGWITVIIAVCGVATIGFSKPKRGDSGITAALTASLLAGILAFTISWAWQPIANRTKQASQSDLQLLTDHVFLHPDDRHLAEETLFDRYPGLPDAKPWERGNLLKAKITSDQASSIPGGIWVGLIVTGFITCFPMFITSVLASLIWQREYRGWAFFWRSMEIGFYASLLMLMLCRSLSTFTGASPAWPFQVVSFIVTIGAIAIAMKRKSVWWRVPAFLLLMFTTILNMSDANKVEAARWLANGAGTESEFAELAPYMERLVAHDGDRENRFRLAAVYAFLGDDENYLKHCRELLANGNFYQRRVAEQTAKVLLLKPSLHKDLTRVHELARIASEQKGYNGWDFVCRALSELRQSNSDEAIGWSVKSRDTAIRQEMWQKEMLIATAHLVEALAHHTQGNTIESANSLKKAEEYFDPESKSSFEAKLIYRLLKSELPDSVE